MIYKTIFGSANAPITYETPEGYPLGRWQFTLKKDRRDGKLNNMEIRHLIKIGLRLDLKSFEEGLCETIIYGKEFGDVNASLKYKTPEGYKLGSWQREQKQLYKRNKLEPYMIDELEKIGFNWGIGVSKNKDAKTGNTKTTDLRYKAFEDGFQASLDYKEQFGYANAPISYKTADGYELDYWQSRQRAKYKRRELTPDEIKRLEEIGFIWDSHKAEFEKRIQASLECRERLGDVNVPLDYKTPSGYNLGQWQYSQRFAYRKGILADDRVMRLEEIGFRWDFKGGSLSEMEEGEG